MGAPKKPIKKPSTKPAEDIEDEDDQLEDDNKTKSKFDDDDDDFDLPLDDNVAGFEEIGFDDDDDF
jgi:hypothetical protein